MLTFYTIVDWMNTLGVIFIFLKIFPFGTLGPFTVNLGQILLSSVANWPGSIESLKLSQVRLARY